MALSVRRTVKKKIRTLFYLKSGKKYQNSSNIFEFRGVSAVHCKKGKNSSTETGTLLINENKKMKYLSGAKSYNLYIQASLNKIFVGKIFSVLPQG